MKTLYLMRHGHAESKANEPDVNRNLDAEGREEVQITSEKMLKAGINPSLIISSHANRAFQTAEIVANTLGYNAKNIEIEKDVYYTGRGSLAEVLGSQDDKYHSILIAGHNPAISMFATTLCADYNETMPTGSVLAFELNTNSWDTFLEHDIKFLSKIPEPVKRI